MNFIVSSTTDIGLSKKTNQDSHIVRSYSTKLGKIVLAVLCDGMGGLAKGEVASSSLVYAFCKWSDEKLPLLCETGITESAIRSDWIKIAKDCNEKIKAYGRQCGISLGTTISAILLTENQYFIMNVGDSRVYELADNINILTKDHSLVAREVELGHLTPEEAEKDSRRNVLLQCVGASETVHPDIFVGNTKLNAVYMLCSDGFRHEITPGEIYSMLNPDVMTDADMMKANMDALIELNKQRQERDNITVISVRTF